MQKKFLLEKLVLKLNITDIVYSNILYVLLLIRTELRIH